MHFFLPERQRVNERFKSYGRQTRHAIPGNLMSEKSRQTMSGLRYRNSRACFFLLLLNGNDHVVCLYLVRQLLFSTKHRFI